MKKLIVFFAAALLCACATHDGQPTQDTEQAVRDYIEVQGLTEADRVSTSSRDHWKKIDQNFILYEAGQKTYLIEFSRRCNELDQLPVVPDVRKSGNLIFPRADTIRGCRIARMFELQEGELEELQSIGESPGSRN